MEHELLSIGKTANLLGVSINTLRIWDKKGILKTFRATPTSNRYYRKEDIDHFLSKKTQKDEIDLIALSNNWVTSNPPIILPDQFYCKTSDIFKARHQRLFLDLSNSANLNNLASLIAAAVGEIANNSFDHNLGNWPDTPGIFFGYELKKQQIILADRGQGILKTLHKVIPELKNDEEALDTAFTKVVTERLPEKRGNGLKYVKEIITKNPLRLFFQTGNAQLELQQNDIDLKITKTNLSFHGCLAIIKFNL